MSCTFLKPTNKPMKRKNLFSITVLIIGLLVPVLLCGQALAVDLQISQLTDDPDPAIRGGQITYSITVENNANDTATGVQLSVPLPDDTTFVSVSDPPGTPTCSYNGGTRTVTCNFGDLVGTLIGGPVYTVDVVAQTLASTPATIDITATITPDTNPPDTNPANNVLTQNTTIDDGADLIVAKSDAPDPVLAGGNITYTIDVTNNGPNDAYTITVEDVLSPNMTYGSAGGTDWSCSHNGVNPGGAVTCQRATLANGATAPAITLVAQETGAITGTITNEVAVSAATGDPDLDNNTITEDTEVTLGTDLAITKSVAPNPVISDGTATFTLRPRNNGPFPAVNVVVTDTLPAGFTYVNASGSGWSCSHDGSPTGGIVTCTRATYAVGATDNILIDTTAPTVVAVTPAANSADIDSDTQDPVPANDSTTLNFNVVPDGVDLSVIKNKTPNPVAQNSDMTSTFTVHNNGPQTAASGTITVTDTLNNALETYTDPNYSGANWTCSYSAPTISCTYNAALLSGANTSTLTIITTAVGVGSITNDAVVSYSGTPGDWDSSNNDDDATVTSTAEIADLTIAKSATTPGSDTLLTVAEDTITYTIDVHNNGPDAATGIVMTDTVAGYFSSSTGVAVTTSPANYTCTTGSTVTCTQQSGSLASGATDHFVIQVTRPLYDGSQTNTATVNSTEVGDPDHTNNSDTATVIIDPICDVQMQNKTVTPASVPAGTDATYVMTFRNNGPSTAQNVVVADVFSIPGGQDFTLISATPSEGSCSWSDPTLTCTGITLNNGETRTVTVIIMPNWQSGDPTWTIDNTATIATTTTESDLTNNTQGATLNVKASDLDLLVNKTDLVDPIGYDPGDPANNVITYQVVITNRGPSLATSVVLSDAMTPKVGKTLRFLGDRANTSDTIGDNSDDICDNYNSTVTGSSTLNITCNCPDMNPITTYTRYLDFRVETQPEPTGDTHYNIATVSSSEIDRLPANDSEAETTSVRQRVDIEVAKTPLTNPVQLREPFDWTITVTNNGPGHSNQTNLIDTLPTGMEFYGPAPTWSKTAPVGSGACSTSGRDLTCNLGWLDPGAVATITVPVRVTSYPSGGTTTNCATAITSEFDPDSTNNTNQCGTVEVQRSSIEGYVYRDLNDNGAMEGGETGISGVQLTLTGTDAYGNTVNRTATTNANGLYRFNNLSPSDASGYTITETQPISYFDGLDSDDNGVTTIPGSRATDVISSIDVPSNTALTGYLFGELPAASINGYAWHDEDNDGVRDGGETTGIQNVQITLTGTNDLGNPVNETVFTDANGFYSFSALRPSNGSGYTLTETAPAGWLPGLAATGTGAAGAGTADNNPASTDFGNIISAVILSFGNTAIEYNFGELQPASIAGLVFNDNNGDGIRDAGEPGIANVTVTLTGTDDLGTAVNIPGTTAADGTFSFTDLRPGTYALVEIQPPNYVDGIDTAGSLGGTVANDNISNIIVSSADAGIDYLFAEQSAGIAGTVYVDSNNDGVQDPGETGIPGVTITLTGTDSGGNPVNATATTDANGNYLIVGLPVSSATGYTIIETQPPAWADGLDSAGTAGGTVGNDIISNIVLNSIAIATDYDFGEIGGSLAGTVYNDINNNGIDEPAEPGIPNATVTLTGTDIDGNAINSVTTTAADGSYSFTDLPMPNAAGYTITETQPAGWNDGQDTLGTLGGTLGNDVFSAIIFPSAGATGTEYNFCEIVGTAGVGQVSGTVWLDLNHDRIDNDGSPQEGWVVELIQRSNPLDNNNYTLIATTFTNAAGDYAIEGLSPGTYEIRFRHPSGGYIYGHPISIWPGVDLDYGTIRDLTLAGGDNATHQDLPLDPMGVVYDSVTRLPIAGATVTISGPPGFDPAVHLVGGAGNASQTTDATGLYQFLLLNTAPPGTYTLTITAYPTGYVPSNSVLIPPCSNTLTVLAAPPTAVVQNNVGPPTTSAPGVCPATSAGLAAGADTTQYFLSFDFDPATSANVVNNHIPLDPAGEAFLITKTVNKKTATVGDLILYTLRIQNTTAADFLGNITIRDNIPAGFKYVEGSARIDGQPITPVGLHPIEFQGLTFLANQTRIITYILVVGSGVQEGEYENTAFAMRGGNRISNIARARVCVIKDPIFDLTTIIGKVFHDKNENGIQDEGEEGIALAKVVSVRGEIVTTDKFGRYHIAGVDPGRYDRGSNFILKVDPKSLPQGARVTTENPRVIRITSALMQKINFGVQLPPQAPPEPGEAVEPMQEGSGEYATKGEKPPSISVSQDRFLTAPKLNLSIGNDTALMITDSGLVEDIAFLIYTNYPDFIQEYKIIIYDKADFECKYPLKTIVLKSTNNYEPVYWDGILDNGKLIEPNKAYKYILEVYNEAGRRDETLPKFFTVSHGALFPREKGDEKVVTEGELPGFGIDNTAQRSIIPEGGKVIMYGKDLAPTDQVYIDGEYVVVAEDGSFVAESIKSPGEHESTIVVKDGEGAVKASQVEKIDVGGEPKGSLKAFFKDFFKDFFIVGIVDLTLGQYSFKGHIEPVSQDDHYDEEIYVDGRAAFYLKGKIKGKYLLTAYLDTEEGEIQDIYKRLGEKDPRRIFRNLDPDKYYPVYGDDSTLVSDVATQGKFYVKVEWNKSMALWGNYHTQITGTELAKYNRSLYGAKVYYESVAETRFGDPKGVFTGFVAECPSFQDHNEFLSTGGSLYYLRHQRVVEGSDKVSIEIRDKDSGRVINTATLLAGADYDIDYYQGRIILSAPLPILADSYSIISSALVNGDDVFLVVDYEYDTECFCGVEDLTGGVRGFGWLGDHVGLGATFVREKRDDTDYNLYGIDAKIKLLKGTYTNIEFASSRQTQIPGSFSVDGGLSFSSLETSARYDTGNAYKVEQIIDFKEITGGDVPLDLEAYYVFREEGFSSLGKDTEHDTTEFGMKLQYDITKNHTLRVKHSTFDEEDDFFEHITTAQLESRWTERFRSILELRHKKLRESEDNIQPVHPEADAILGTQEDVIAGARVEYDLKKGTQLYAAQQVSLYRNDDTPENNKTTLGISSQLTDWLRGALEGFGGNLGYGGRVGLTASVNEKTDIYTSYIISTDRTEGRAHKVTLGSTYKMNDKTDIYSENQFKNTQEETSNSDIIGITYLPTDRWHIDVKYENSRVTKDRADSYVEHNIIKRDTGSLGVTYDYGPLRIASRLELRFDRGDVTEHQYVTTNTLKYDVNKEWTFLGKCNYSLTRDLTDSTDDAHFFEVSTGFAYRPITLDKLNMLFKYTFLEDLAPLSQDGSTDVDERSHVVSLEGIYDLSRYFSLGGKAAYKSSQMRLGRTSGEWFYSDTMLFAGRVNYHVIKNWDAELEYRFLRVVQADDYKHGPVVCLYRHFGDHVKLGVGYNFTDFNDDLTNLDYESGGWFVNFVAKW
jgi:uncharacterized repeat protein (TIGR01451 family)